MQPRELPPWLEPVAKHVELWRIVGEEEPPAGATDDEIAVLRQQARLHGLHVDDQVAEFLKFINGMSFNGCSFAGAAIPENDAHCRNDLIRYNDPEFDFTDGDATFYGSCDDVTFRYSKNLHQFQIVELDVFAEFKTFGELVQYVFAEQLAVFPKKALKNALEGSTDARTTKLLRELLTLESPTRNVE